MKELKKDGDSVTATLGRRATRRQTVTAERVVLAVGIVGNVENIGLEKTKVKVEKTHIVVDQWLRHRRARRLCHRRRGRAALARA